jgi:hypothetical protein
MKKTLSLSLAAALTVATMLPNAHAADAKAVSTSAAKAHGQMAANKALVLKAYQELLGDHDLTALDRYWAKEYIQHNPSMGDGTDAVKQFMEKPSARPRPRSTSCALRPKATWFSSRSVSRNRPSRPRWSSSTSSASRTEKSPSTGT